MEDVEVIIFFTVSLLFLLIGLVLVSTIIASYDPYYYIATQNVEKLRNAMDQACAGNAQKISFSLPQNTPAFTTLITSTSSWLIHRGGDPNYVLYYEMFPAGDAIGWETFYNFNPRALVSLPEALSYNSQDPARSNPIDTKNADGVDIYFDDMKKEIDKKQAGGNSILTDIIIIRNVILSNKFKHYENYAYGKGGEKSATFKEWGSTGDGTTSEELPTKFFGFGEWKYDSNKDGMPDDGDNYFEFRNYNGLPDIEKASIKYIPCGDHALCLKTRSGVLRYELGSGCDDIQYVAFAYDDRKVGEGYAAAIGGTVATAGLIYLGGGAALAAAPKVIWWVVRHPGLAAVGAVVLGYAADKVANYFFSIFLTYKSSDFNIVSPCAIDEMEIRKVPCNTFNYDMSNHDEYKCNRLERIPLMTYDENGVSDTTYDHYTCIEKPKKMIDSLPDPSTTNNVYSDIGGNCLLVKVNNVPKGYCWTPDPYKEILDTNPITSAKNLFSEGPTQALARNLGLVPIAESTSYDYVDSQIVTLLMSYNELDDFIDKTARRLSWAWPQDKSDKSAISDVLGVGAASLID
ncbi:MAG: hypothetical protein QMD85_00145 [Candidatus Aenigmarchaeota archaeon]|nr:hypothetical protein [Candidatus Aenigmarchaeota archaeon]MDI6721937.1 hypothetical protein [Candidatus Aenigmarchaeota archaeon]